MNANENHLREDQPRNINPEENNVAHPAKALKAQEKIDIKQSELGREQGQTPADEHIERFSQIDDDTRSMMMGASKKEDQPTPENDNGENGDAAGYMNDANSNTDRDTGNSTQQGWEAESSRTGRHK